MVTRCPSLGAVQINRLPDLLCQDLSSLPMVILRGNLSYVSIKVPLLDGVSLCGACFGNQPGFLVLGAIEVHTFFGQLCSQSRKNEFPLNVNTDI